MRTLVQNFGTWSNTRISLATDHVIDHASFIVLRSLLHCHRCQHKQDTSCTMTLAGSRPLFLRHVNLKHPPRARYETSSIAGP